MISVTAVQAAARKLARLEHETYLLRQLLDNAQQPYTEDELRRMAQARLR